MSTFYSTLSSIADGESVDQLVTNRQFGQLLSNTIWLKDRITSMTESKALFIRDVAVISSALVGQPVYWNNGNSRYELALADGTVKQNVVGLVFSKAGSTRADLVILGFAAVDLTNSTGGAGSNNRYWLSDATPGMLTTVRPSSHSVAVCLADGVGNVIVVLQTSDSIGPQGSQGSQGNQGFQGRQGFQG